MRELLRHVFLVEGLYCRAQHGTLIRKEVHACMSFGLTWLDLRLEAGVPNKLYPLRLRSTKGGLPKDRGQGTYSARPPASIIPAL